MYNHRYWAAANRTSAIHGGNCVSTATAETQVDCMA